MPHLIKPTNTRPLLMIGMGLLSGLAWPMLNSSPPWLPGLLIGIAIGITDWRCPQLTAPLWRATRWLGQQLGHYNGSLLSALFYLIVITPVGLAIQIFYPSNKITRTSTSFYQTPDARQKKHMLRVF